MQRPENETNSALSSLAGSIERVTFHNAENGYSVLRVKTSENPELVTLIGHLNSANPGEFIEAKGTWVQHRDFGRQFKAESIRSIEPSTLEGIERYLGSGMLKGIGPHFAKKLVEAFGAEVFDVIEKSPHRLKRVRGLGLGRIEKISFTWKEQRGVRDIMVFLQSHGVGTAKAVRIYKTYGADAITQVKQNPYQLARDIHGIGFKSADQIAANLGIAKNSIIRARAGIHFVLQEREGEGSCAYPEDDLIAESAILLEMELATVREAVELEVKDKHLFREKIEGRDCIYGTRLFRAENEVARLLGKLIRGAVPWGELDVDAALAEAGRTLGIQLASLQQEAVRTALRSKVMVITGGPGTGKTTLTRALISILKRKNQKIALCSPTGRASKRLSECTGMEAKTIHRFLGVDRKTGGFLHHERNPFSEDDFDLLVVDESSMVDIHLLHHLLKAIPSRAAIVFVGDVDQIPSVGPGKVLDSLIESGVIPVVRLTQIYRQAAESQIISNAHRINQGEMPQTEFSQGQTSDFHFIGTEETSEIVKKVIELVQNRIPKRFGLDPVRDIQVLSPMNRGPLGARALNIELQKALNPRPSAKIEKFGLSYGVGDKVMVTLNDYDKEVFNGDIGFIKRIDGEEQEVVIDFDGREVSFEFAEMDLVTLAYATSIHKSQGSEYPAVVLPVSMQHFIMLKRNLIYTGVTRGKKLVVMVGQRKALATAIQSSEQGKRWNKLAEKLRLEISLALTT